MKVLIIRPGALGDTLLMLPALAALKGKATVDFAGRQPGLGYIGDTVCRAMDLETAGWHRLFADPSGVSGRSPLPVSRADRIVAFFKDEGGIIRGNLKAFFPGASVWVLPAFPPKGKQIHVARYLARRLQLAGLPVNSDGALREAGRRPLLSGPWVSKKRDRMIFHPGSGAPKKNHSPEFWMNLLQRHGEMPRFARLRPTLLLGPAEAPLQDFFRNHTLVPRLEILFCPEKEQLLNVLGSAAFYLGHDSGVTQLSGLMGTPTVALFKQTDPVQWGPLGPYVRIIHRQKADPKLFELIMAAVNAMFTVFSDKRGQP